MSSAIEIGVKEGNVYHLTGNPIQAQVHVVMNPCELWHRKFGHLNSLASSKNVKKPYSGSSRRSKGILDPSHSDLCSPMTTPVISGCLYFVIIHIRPVLFHEGDK